MRRRGAGKPFRGEECQRVIRHRGAIRGEAPVEDDRERPFVREIHEDDVRRLHVAVRGLLPLAGAQCADQLRRDIDRLRRVQLALQGELAAAEAAREFVNEHRTVVVRVGVEELADVGAGDLLQLLRIRQKFRDVEAVIQVALLHEKLQRDLPVRDLVHGAIHQRAVADGEPREDVVSLGGESHRWIAPRLAGSGLGGKPAQNLLISIWIASSHASEASWQSALHAATKHVFSRGPSHITA